jgi:IMP dehydrogenase
MDILPSLTFDDVLIEPQYSEVQSRSMVSVVTNLGPTFTLDVPIISANMDSITEYDMAVSMGNVGGLGILHRFMTTDEQVDQINRFKWTNGTYIGAAVGIKDDCFDRATRCLHAGADTLVLDVAHGHSKSVAIAMGRILSHYPDAHIIAGNVATYEGAKFLIEHGASAVKVGVGPGSVCSTRIVAGVGVPQLSAIMEASRACKEYDIPLIADGGIRYPGDAAKAMAAGASAVMIGGLLSGTIESPGHIVEKGGRLFKAYRGMASKGAMTKRREVEVKHLNGSSPEPRFEHITPEGVETLVPFTNKSAGEVVAELVGGLRSAMSYSNSTSIREFHENVKFVRITNAGLAESHPHALNQ